MDQVRERNRRYSRWLDAAGGMALKEERMAIGTVNNTAHPIASSTAHQVSKTLAPLDDKAFRFFESLF